MVNRPARLVRGSRRPLADRKLSLEFGVGNHFPDIDNSQVIGLV
jgi:hypothetical protein